VTAAEFAPAKVNLFLRVTGRRADGYHTLDTLVVFAGAGDVVALGATPGLTVDGPFAAGLGAAPDNLVLRAACALAAAAGHAGHVSLRLTKNLPVASGVGGGSADAAATLRLLNRAWHLHWPEARLGQVAAGLGADVPMCVAARPLRAGGIGHDLAPAPHLPRFGLLLANPGLPVSTAEVFRGRSGEFALPAVLPEGWPDAASMAAALHAIPNDLEPAAVALCPPVGELMKRIAALPGCLLARMSGSGATCFGLFPPDVPIPVPDAPWTWSGVVGSGR
jgi:4-diphosphocytidyl-2-C-methyl-D-erythritol kinase